ncbi:MAG: filamentous hemagglutinin N-terminal domain-containing protein [Parachlamydiales bacterium]|nr:filamentous hemagglutinin N-terminal domain-containing protein [Parachlamydiales bacterium]
MNRFFLTLGLAPFFLFSLPQGLQISEGTALSSLNGETLSIQTGDHAELNWSDFSIGEQEAVIFAQPSEASLAINRVIGNSPSQIFGHLQANGQIILINPNGIVFGKESRIDVGSLIASTLDLHSRLKFSGESAALVENYGTIHAKWNAALFGKEIYNSGVIEIQNGTCAIVAGREVEWRGDSFSAKTLRDQEEFTLTTLEGTIQAEGGSVYVMGDRIWLKEGSLIDVSHDQNGGAIFIGGDFQGKNPDFQNAEYIVFERGATVCADSRIQGNGGKAILWADRFNMALGTVYARGGRIGGNGGLAEISAENLQFDALADLSASNGKAGELFLDPTDITIGGASCATVAIGNPTTWTAACGCPVNISAGAIQGALGGANVTISTATAPDLNCGNGGLITVSSPITWGSAFSLTLTGNTFNIVNTIQNAGTGNVTINATGNSVLIGPGAVGINAAVGSRDGQTCVNAPNATVTLSAGSLRVAQIGFRSGAGVQATGSIKVNCDALNLRAPVGGNSAAQIGHGISSTQGVGNNSSTSDTATIDVCVRGNIDVDTFGPGSAIACIGHGSRSTAVGTIQDGDISVVSQRGNIFVRHSNVGAGPQAIARIGHGYSTHPTGMGIFNGNITVRAPQGSINILSNASNNNCFSFIGHGGSSGCGAGTISGNIYVASLGDIWLDGRTPGTSNQRVAIGAVYSLPVTTLNQQNIRVLSGHDIILRARQRTYIGNFFQTGGVAAVCQGNVEVVAGNDIILRTLDNDVMIGTTIAPLAPVAASGNVFVAAGHDIVVQTQSVPPIASLAYIESVNNLSVVAGNDIFVISSANGVSASIGTANRFLGNAVVRIYAGRDIIANNAAGGNAILGYDPIDFAPNVPYSVDIRANGNIQFANGFTTFATTSTLTGPIFVEADCCFTPAQLWGYSADDDSVCANGFSCTGGASQCQCDFAGIFLTSISGIPLPLPMPEANLLPNPINQNSGQIDANGEGAFFVSTSSIFGNHVSFETSTGNITVHSAPFLRRNLPNDPLIPQNIEIGPLAMATPFNTLDIVTVSGDIDVGGTFCRCLDGFHDITINGVDDPWTDGGDIYGRAANNFIVQTNVSTTGSGTVTLISDCDRTAVGNVVINADVAAVDGDLTLLAGRLNNDPPNCSTPNICAGQNGSSANILHGNATTVQCTGSGVITEMASGSISLSNATIQADSGNIRLIAGVDINVSSNILSASGNILLIANQNVRLQSASSLIESTTGSVTIVVDNAFPSQPLMGTGAIFTVIDSQINGSPLQIYTSQQTYNSIQGFLNGDLFSAGTLFQNTSLEQWCTYFGCPFQRIGLGLPYTVFYKNCLQEATQQATVIVDQMLVSLHPANEYPGWMVQFYLIHDEKSKTPYFIRRRVLNSINHPKTWTAWLNIPRMDQPRY